MQKLCRTRALDAGILVLVLVAARVALAQEPPRATPPIRVRTLPADGEGRPSLEPMPTVPSTAPMAPPSLHADGRIALQLKDGSRLVGKLVGAESLKFKAAFGEIDVPLTTLLGFKIAETASSTGGVTTTTTILFKNGDVITAEPILATLKLETVFGETAIAGKHLESLVMTTERLTWVNDGKWRLVPDGGSSWGRAAAMPAYTPHGGPYAAPSGGPFIPGAFTPTVEGPPAPGGADPFAPRPSLTLPPSPMPLRAVGPLEPEGAPMGAPKPTRDRSSY